VGIFKRFSLQTDGRLKTGTEFQSRRGYFQKIICPLKMLIKSWTGKTNGRQAILLSKAREITFGNG
jgi:hypothetical protein